MQKAVSLFFAIVLLAMVAVPAKAAPMAQSIRSYSFLFQVGELVGNPLYPTEQPYVGYAWICVEYHGCALKYVLSGGYAGNYSGTVTNGDTSIAISAHTVFYTRNAYGSVATQSGSTPTSTKGRVVFPL